MRPVFKNTYAISTKRMGLNGTIKTSLVNRYATKMMNWKPRPSMRSSSRSSIAIDSSGSSPRNNFSWLGFLRKQAQLHAKCTQPWTARVASAVIEGQYLIFYSVVLMFMTPENPTSVCW